MIFALDIYYIFSKIFILPDIWDRTINNVGYHNNAGMEGLFCIAANVGYHLSTARQPEVCLLTTPLLNRIYARPIILCLTVKSLYLKSIGYYLTYIEI